jgi:hypothetical protein
MAATACVEERKGKSRDRKKRQPPVKDKAEQREEKQRKKGTRISQKTFA